MLTNPALNYVQFLLRAIIPTVLHVLIAIAGGYAVGSEFASRSLQQWMATAGGSPLTALVGKLAPYFGIFIVMMAIGVGVIHGVFRIPFRGNPVMMGGAACLLVIAYLSVGALFQLLVKNLALGLALTGIVCSPAFGFAGVGFPILSMGWFARTWGDILPLRWYIQILVDQAARGVPVTDSRLSSRSAGLRREFSDSPGCGRARSQKAPPSPRSRRRKRKPAHAWESSRPLPPTIDAFSVTGGCSA